MKKCLIIQIKMIGDVLTSTIILDSLKHNYPNITLHYLVEKRTLPVIENHPAIDKAISVEKLNRDTIFLLSKQLKAEKYDLIIDVYSKINTALLSFLIGNKAKFGIYKWYTQWAYSKTIKYRTKSLYHTQLSYENRLQFLEPLSVPIDYSLKPKIYLTTEEQEKTKQICINHGINYNEQPHIMVSILGSSTNKTYPLAYLAKLLDSIANTFKNVKFLFNYIPAQQAEVNRLIELCNSNTQKLINPYYAKNLRDFITLTSFCSMSIGNEGGLINMSKALDIPTFAIFSPWITTKAWGTKNQENHEVVHLEDFYPEDYESSNRKELKENTQLLYQKFTPNLIQKKLLTFVEKQLT
ncbi:heptosyltransferase-2 [Mesonia hippocampi]|uniref:Heptosyltransferase-2 n=1 Tax=Mesonia hippocampi TaxID=1628250 RepID=A0A840ER65_9FLAO|nr:glycosyltransferase family 9 protein [Mesonia hippocampi]MBB4119545.1 heptosyltransferase-2 [Mesonia hippocampi]